MESDSEPVRAAPRIPSATYRLQFNADFGFRHASDIVGYFHDLGITDIYASPYFKARPGSPHGYDIIAHNELNPEVGTREEYECFVEGLQQLGMGQILDIVPNHMCVEGGGNLWWQDLLENGPSSVYARTFDIDWDPVKKELRNKVLIPILGDQYGNVLENGELVLIFNDGAFELHYYEHRFPIIPKTYHQIIGHRLEWLKDRLGLDALPFQEILSILTALQHLPAYTETDAERVSERYREKEVVKRRLHALYIGCPAVAEFIDENVRIFNGRPGVPESYDLLDRLLAEQVYRIAHWRVATEEINYRRFFDVNALGAIRVEDENVFDETHRFVLQLIRQGKVTGLRVDHVDGLYDPEAYLCHLRDRLAEEVRGDRYPGQEEFADEIPTPACPAEPSCYLIGEKILMQEEQLPNQWPVHGTTGYSFLNSVNGVFVDSANTRKFDVIYGRFVRSYRSFREIATEAKRLVMQVAMSSDINTLSHILNLISERNRHTRDFTLNSLTKALAEVVVFFPVYRTYIRSHEISGRDRQSIEQAVAKARRNNPAMGSSVFDFIQDVLLLRCPAGCDPEDLRLRLDFVMRFQQFTGPVMAKGVEDTACYVYNRLVSLNEVGGAPERMGCSLDAFHQRNLQRLQTYPYAMITTSTHDTKRSEDVRARINVLSEVPDLWRKGLITWSQINRKRKRDFDGQPAPSRNEEYFLYQTLLGVWPCQTLSDEEFDRFRNRIKAYMRKAIREAKVNSSWIDPNVEYEQAVEAFIDAAMGNADTSFVRSFLGLARYVSRLGMFNSLSQTLLKITSPGTPDFYQGTELWTLSLVDPDNRGSVDFALRCQILAQVRRTEQHAGRSVLCKELLAHMEEGSIKLYVTSMALRYRRDNRKLFEQGRYVPIPAVGSAADSVIAFGRACENKTILVVVPRFLSHIMGDADDCPLGDKVWGDTTVELSEELFPGLQRAEAGSILSGRNIFTDELVCDIGVNDRSLSVGKIFGQFPVALIEWDVVELGTTGATIEDKVQRSRPGMSDLFPGVET